MAPKYILHYFDIKGRAEHIRYIFHYKKVAFEDHRIDRSNLEWKMLKPQMPSGQVPVLEVDGKKLSQSVAICRYLGTEFKLNGSNAWENAKLDEAVQNADDITKDISVYRVETDEAKKETLRKELVEQTLPNKYNTLARIIDVSDTKPFILGSKPTWADFFVAATAERSDSLILNNTLSGINRGLSEYIQRVKSLDGVKEYVAQRKYTES